MLNIIAKTHETAEKYACGRKFRFLSGYASTYDLDRGKDEILVIGPVSSCYRMKEAYYEAQMRGFRVKLVVMESQNEK